MLIGLAPEPDRAHDREDRCGRVTDDEILKAGRHQADRSSMLEDVADRDENGETEQSERLDAAATLHFKGGSRCGLRLRRLRLMGRTLADA